MDPHDRYIHHITGEAPGEPPLRVRPPTRSLLASQAQAAELSAASQAPALDPALRSDLQGKRSPLLPEILHLCARGLSMSPALADQVGVSAGLCESVLRQDTALGQLIKAGGDLHAAATAAAGQVADEAHELGERALAAARDFIQKPGVDPATKLAVEVSFGEPFRLFEEANGRRAREEKRRAARLRPLREARDQARAETAELRLIDQFLGRFACPLPARRPVPGDE